MKYAGIEVTKGTTINQPVRVAIFLVSIGDPSAPYLTLRCLSVPWMGGLDDDRVRVLGPGERCAAVRASLGRPGQRPPKPSAKWQEKAQARPSGSSADG